MRSRWWMKYVRQVATRGQAFQLAGRGKNSWAEGGNKRGRDMGMAGKEDTGRGGKGGGGCYASYSALRHQSGVHCTWSFQCVAGMAGVWCALLCVRLVCRPLVFYFLWIIRKSPFFQTHRHTHTEAGEGERERQHTACCPSRAGPSVLPVPTSSTPAVMRGAKSDRARQWGQSDLRVAEVI